MLKSVRQFRVCITTVYRTSVEALLTKRTFSQTVHARGQAISRLADGREVAVQLLSAEENVAESDIILSVRRWHVCDRKLDPAVDLIISKHNTFSQLRDTIATLADLEGFMPEAALDPDAEPVAQPASPQAEREAQPESESELKLEPQAEPKVLQLRRLGLAKASAFGPPLDHRVCRPGATHAFVASH
jgi:hypothetical protein